jgi:CTP:molybdopterin cytidylyltransferase MocA
MPSSGGRRWRSDVTPGIYFRRPIAAVPDTAMVNEPRARAPVTAPLAARGAIVGVVLAAGAGRRFGSPKQLALFEGRPLLEHALLAMAGARRIDDVLVVVGAHADAVLAGVERHGASAVICADWEEGQAASLRAGVAAVAGRADAVVITLGDQPAIDPRAIDRLIGSRDGTSLALRAGYNGRPGHPVLLERALLEQVVALRGDAGARGLLAGAGAKVVACDGLGCDLDIDTVEELRLSGGGSTPAS